MMPAAEIFSSGRVTPLRFALVVSLLLLLCILVFVVCVLIGPTSVPISEMDIIGSFREALRGHAGSPEATILFQVRLPRVLLAAVVGAALSASGTSFQALLRNPLADPYILGVSGGGALGAILAFVLGLKASRYGMYAVPLFAFAGSLGTMLAVFSIARSAGRVPAHTLLLTGVIANALLSAVIMFLISIMSRDQVHDIVFWMMGNLESRPYPVVLTVAVYVAAGLVVLFGMARAFNLFSLGEETALHLGLNVEQSKLLVFVSASLITGAVVSVSGLIGFVGLIVPHIGRLILGPDHRLLIPAVVLIGAIFLMICDTLARVLLAPGEIPVGVITALAGGPFFIYLLRRRQAQAFVEE